MKGNEICVPVKALAITGEQEEPITPEGGERVSVTVEGTVRVEGDKAYISPSAVNGEAVVAQGGAEPKEDTEEELRRLATDLEEEDQVPSGLTA